MGKQKFILIQFILVLHVCVNRSQVFANRGVTLDDLIAGVEGANFPARCSNPNGRLGKCISIYECPPLLDVIKAKQVAAYDFVRKSKCAASGRGLQPFVCCTSDTGFATRSAFNGRIIFPDQSVEDIRKQAGRITTKAPPPLTESSLLPKPPMCGPVLIGNKIYGGEEAQLGEFPWLASLEYKQPHGGLTSVCAGNIINRRYILTAAHCVKGNIEKKVGQLVSARVGVHNTQAPIDWNNVGCLDNSQRLDVAKAIVHSGYNASPSGGFRNLNDIALLRTDRDMHYSFSVAPVCLPNVFRDLPELRTGEKLSVAGWGHTGLTKTSAAKLKVELPYVENRVCPFRIASEQLCAGGEFYKDSCNGDSGGGLVRLVNDAWIVEGLVSFGRGCGLEEPGIYTRISSYIPWIYANIEP